MAGNSRVGGRHGDPSWDPSAKTFKHLRKTDVFVQKPWKTAGKPMFWRKKLRKPRENTGVGAKSLENQKGKPVFWRKKLRQPEENIRFCAKRLENQRNSLIFGFADLGAP